MSQEQTQKEINYVRQFIIILSELCNKNIFMNLYKKHVNNRLDDNCNPDIENEFLKSVNPKDDIETIKRFSKYFISIIASIVQNLDIKVRDISILNADERNYQLIELNKNVKDLIAHTDRVAGHTERQVRETQKAGNRLG